MVFNTVLYVESVVLKSVQVRTGETAGSEVHVKCCLPGDLLLFMITNTLDQF